MTFSRKLPVLAGLLLAAAAHAQVFTAGDLVVTVYGADTTGTDSTDSGSFSEFAGASTSAGASTTPIDGVPTAISLVEFATSGGGAVNSFTLPTTDGVNGAANVGMVGEYGSSSEGAIQLSGNGQYLTIAGYSVTPSLAAGSPDAGYGNSSPYNGTALAQSTDTAVPRVFATINANGVVNSSTVINDLYSTNNPRSVYSPDGTTLYLSGQGSGTTDQGLYSTTVGTNTVTGGAKPTTIYNAVDTRFVTQYAGVTYISMDKKGGTTAGVYSVNTSTGALTRLTASTNGLTGSSMVSYSPEAFWFANASTLYVADTGAPKNVKTNSSTQGAGGIQKWIYNGTSWNLAYSFVNPVSFVSAAASPGATAGETGFASITGQVNSNGTVSLFATSYTANDAEPDGLYAVNDLLGATTAGADTQSESITELESSSSISNSAIIKGVSFTPLTAVPEPSTYGLMGAGALGVAAAIRRRRRKAL